MNNVLEFELTLYQTRPVNPVSSIPNLTIEDTSEEIDTQVRVWKTKLMIISMSWVARQLKGIMLRDEGCPRCIGLEDHWRKGML